MYIPLQRQIIRTSNNIKHINSMKALSKEQAMYYLLIINPINEILEGLNQNKFNDNSILYLNQKLEIYTNNLLKILNINFRVGEKIEGKINDYNKQRFIKYFSFIKEQFTEFM